MACLARRLVLPLHSSFHQSVLPLLSATKPAVLISEPTTSVAAAVCLHTSAIVERARQSTRLRKRKVVLENIKKKEERLRKNPPPIPKKVRLMMKLKGLGSEPIDWRAADTKPFPTDNVWDEQWTTWRRLSVGQAVDCLREHYHPTMLNNPNGIVMARVELDMTSKKDRYIDAMTKMVPLFHPFERGVTQKTIMLFAKNEEGLIAAKEAGADRAGGIELIEDIAKGKIDVIDYDYFLAHDDILLELKPLLGILREKFPKKSVGYCGHRCGKNGENLPKRPTGRDYEAEANSWLQRRPLVWLLRGDDWSAGHAGRAHPSQLFSPPVGAGRVGAENEKIGGFYYTSSTVC